MTTRPSRTKPTVPFIIDADVQPTSERPSWTAAEKLALLAEYEAFPRGAAEWGAFLRRHGLYTSPMSKWRHLRDQGALALLTPQAHGPKPGTTEPLLAENTRLQQELARVQARLTQAEAVIDLQKNRRGNSHVRFSHVAQRVSKSARYASRRWRTRYCLSCSCWRAVCSTRPWCPWYART